MKHLLYAARPLVSDFFPTIAFAILIALKLDVTIATAGALGIGVLQLVIQHVRGTPVGALQWASLFLVVVFGAVGLITHDPRFIMIKATLIYAAIAVVMLKRGWMLRYLPPVASEHGQGLMILFGYLWSGMMAATAVLNLVVAIWFTKDWPLFIAVFPMASKIALFAIQFTTIRLIVRRRMRAQASSGLAQAA